MVLELERAQVPELVPAQHVLGEQLVEAGRREPPRCAPRAPARRWPARARCTAAATFSAVISSPSAASASSSRPIHACSSITRLDRRDGSPSRSSRVRAASATRMWDWLVSASSRIVSASTALRLDRHQMAAGEAPVARNAAVRHPPVERRAERQPSRPVDGRAASSGARRDAGSPCSRTGARSIAVSRPSASRKRSRRGARARRRSSSWR